MSSGSSSIPAYPLPIRAELDLRALHYNVRQLKARIGQVPLMAVVKADAYGHGVGHVVPILREVGVGAFGVANVPEAIQLRALGVDEPILVFAQPLPAYLPAFVIHGLDVTVGSEEVAEAVLRSGGPYRVHVKVDTGMHRLGIAPDKAVSVIERLRAARHVALIAVWTHLATADEADLSFAREQIARLDAVVRACAEPVQTHIANSGGVAQLPESVTGRALVRPGGLLYGLPSTPTLAQAVDTRPVMRLVSRVVNVQEIGANETVSYGRTWKADVPTLVATVAAGYADGIPRQLSNRGTVSIEGERYPIAGRICMDMLMVDLGPRSPKNARIRAGQEVVLMGSDGPDAMELAGLADTISYAVPSGLTARVPRLVTRS